MPQQNQLSWKMGSQGPPIIFSPMRWATCSQSWKPVVKKNNCLHEPRDLKGRDSRVLAPPLLPAPGGTPLREAPACRGGSPATLSGQKEICAKRRSEVSGFILGTHSPTPHLTPPQKKKTISETPGRILEGPPAAAAQPCLGEAWQSLVCQGSSFRKTSGAGFLRGVSL